MARNAEVIGLIYMLAHFIASCEFYEMWPYFWATLGWLRKHVWAGYKTNESDLMVTTIWFILGLSVTRVVYGEKCGGNRSYLLARFSASCGFYEMWLYFWAIIGLTTKACLDRLQNLWKQSDFLFNSTFLFMVVWLHGMLLNHQYNDRSL